MKRHKPSLFASTKVPITRKEVYPVFMIDPQEGRAHIDMYEEDYKRYKDAAREWYAVQEWLRERYEAVEAAGELRLPWIQGDE